MTCTDDLAAAGRKIAAPQHHARFPDRAARHAHIWSRAEAQIGGAIALEMLADHHHKTDADESFRAAPIVDKPLHLTPSWMPTH